MFFDALRKRLSIKRKVKAKLDAEGKCDVSVI